MAQSFTFAMTYSCNHGLNQSDYMFYLNNRKNQYYPIAKDLNCNVLNINKNSDFKTPLMILSSLLPNWRPNTPSHASYFVMRNDESVFDFPFFWWSVCPQTLNWFSHEDNFNEYIIWLKHFSSSRSLNKLSQRHSQFRSSCTALGIESFSKKNFPIITQDAISIEKLFMYYSKNENHKFSFLKSYIERLTKNKFSPSNKSLNLLYWRNAILKNFSNMETQTLATRYPQSFENLNLNREFIKADNIFTFLYRNETADTTDIIYLQRNCTIGDEVLSLIDEDGEVFLPTNVLEFGSDSADIDIFKLLTNSFSVNEKIKLHYYSIPKKENYQYLKGSSSAGGLYLGPYEISISPIDNSTPNGIKLLGLESLSKKSIDAPVIIKKDEIWNVEQHTKIFLKEDSYIQVYGSLNIEENASLTLTTSGNSWGGIHFHNTNDLNISNLFVEKVGTGESHTISHDGFKYTGAVTFYNSSVMLKNIEIKNSKIEDALHFVNCSTILNNVSIYNSQGDAIDADFCNIHIDGLKIKNSDGDGLDISNSLADIRDIKIYSCADKGLSIGENSRATVINLSVDNSNTGIAIKDMSNLEYENIRFKDCYQDISSYIKKPFYGPPQYKEKSNFDFK